MACSGRYASAAEYDALLCAGLDLTDPDVVTEVESFLDMAAADIHVVMAAQGMCDCTLADWATAYLKKLNIIDAQVLHDCPCGNRPSQAEKERKAIWLEKQFDLIREGKLTLCQGDTGADFPAFGVAQMGYTEWNQAKIIVDEQLRQL
jgi:hypothetical protein